MEAGRGDHAGGLGVGGVCPAIGEEDLASREKKAVQPGFVAVGSRECHWANAEDWWRRPKLLPHVFPSSSFGRSTKIDYLAAPFSVLADLAPFLLLHLSGRRNCHC